MFVTGKLVMVAALTRILCCPLTVTCDLCLQRQNLMMQRKIDVLSSKKQVRKLFFSDESL